MEIEYGGTVYTGRSPSDVRRSMRLAGVPVAVTEQLLPPGPSRFAPKPVPAPAYHEDEPIDRFRRPGNGGLPLRAENLGDVLAACGLLCLYGGESRWTDRGWEWLPAQEPDVAAIIEASVKAQRAKRKRGEDKPEETTPIVIVGGVEYPLEWDVSDNRLKLWAGQQTRTTIIGAITGALLECDAETLDDAIEFAAPCATWGYDSRGYVSPQEAGFSPNQLGIPLLRRPLIELLCGIALAHGVRLGGDGSRLCYSVPTAWVPALAARHLLSLTGPLTVNGTPATAIYRTTLDMVMGKSRNCPLAMMIG